MLARSELGYSFLGTQQVRRFSLPVCSPQLLLWEAL
jgi:hypothetical protein